jgi:hypothetical protein
MGRRTYADKCPNVAVVGDHPLFHKALEEVNANGWGWNEDATYNGPLYPEPFKGPNGEFIYFVNTHPSASVGETRWVVFGPKREHVEAFLKAQGITGVEVQAEAIVQQTL